MSFCSVRAVMQLGTLETVLYSLKDLFTCTYLFFCFRASFQQLCASKPKAIVFLFWLMNWHVEKRRLEVSFSILSLEITEWFLPHQIHSALSICIQRCFSLSRHSRNRWILVHASAVRSISPLDCRWRCRGRHSRALSGGHSRKTGDGPLGRAQSGSGLF